MALAKQAGFDNVSLVVFAYVVMSTPACCASAQHATYIRQNISKSDSDQGRLRWVAMLAIAHEAAQVKHTSLASRRYDGTTGAWPSPFRHRHPADDEGFREPP